MKILLVEKLAGAWWKASDEDASPPHDIVWCGRTHRRIHVASPEDGLAVGDTIDVPNGEVRASL
jgi:hypothetical protein